MSVGSSISTDAPGPVVAEFFHSKRSCESAHKYLDKSMPISASTVLRALPKVFTHDPWRCSGRSFLTERSHRTHGGRLRSSAEAPPQSAGSARSLLLLCIVSAHGDESIKTARRTPSWWCCLKIHDASSHFKPSSSSTLGCTRGRARCRFISKTLLLIHSWLHRLQHRVVGIVSVRFTLLSTITETNLDQGIIPEQPLENKHSKT